VASRWKGARVGSRRLPPRRPLTSREPRATAHAARRAQRIAVGCALRTSACRAPRIYSYRPLRIYGYRALRIAACRAPRIHACRSCAKGDARLLARGEPNQKVDLDPHPLAQEGTREEPPHCCARSRGRCTEASPSLRGSPRVRATTPRDSRATPSCSAPGTHPKGPLDGRTTSSGACWAPRPSAIRRPARLPSSSPAATAARRACDGRLRQIEAHTRALSES